MKAGEELIHIVYPCQMHHGRILKAPFWISVKGGKMVGA